MIITIICIGNYGRAIEDSKAAMKYTPKNVKPYFRCASAYMALEKYEEAIKVSN